MPTFIASYDEVIYIRRAQRVYRSYTNRSGRMEQTGEKSPSENGQT
jgi:hypothetical protein